jgi:hypothetical protein
MVPHVQMHDNQSHFGEVPSVSRIIRITRGICNVQELRAMLISRLIANPRGARDGHGAEPTSSFSALLARQLPMWAKWGYMFPYDAEVHAG